MKETMTLKYGKTTVPLCLDGAKEVRTLLENPMKTIDDVAAQFRYCVEEGAIGGRRLKDVVQPGDDVTIVISDMTRFWMRQDILCELLVRYLKEEIGVAYEQMAVVIALGSHRKSTEEERRKMASAFVADHVAQVVDHDCDGETVYVGTTSFGTEVSVNPLAIGRKLIIISATVHHIMAGYGGGRKSIVPGIVSRKTIKQNHSRALDPAAPKSDARVGSGRMMENPIHLDMAEAGALVHPDFGISLCVNSAGAYSGLFCGDFDLAWKESCLYIQKSYGLPIEEEADVVFVSCGGYPKDLNFYQSTKSLFNGVRAMKPGGTLVLLAECCEGSGAKDFFDWIEPLKEGHLDESLRQNFTIGGYIFYAACEAVAKGRVLLLTSLAPEELQAMGIACFSDMASLMQEVDLEGKTVAVIPYGGNVVPQVKEEYDRLVRECMEGGAKG